MDTSENLHRLEALDEWDDYAGTMEWHPKTGELKNIFVEPNLRRQGIATAMWSRAKEIASETRGVVSPRHSPDRTDEGDVWAKSTGDKVPPRQSKPTHRWDEE